MKAEQIDQALCQKFITEGERLVFWNDSSAEFVDYVQEGLSGELAEVTVLDTSKHGGLATKLRLEREDTQGKYLLYCPCEKPLPEEDWLLDIRTYSATFHADMASIWLQELGFHGFSLRGHLTERKDFLKSQVRRQKLKQLLVSDDDAVAIDLKMTAVVVGSSVADVFSILRALCQGHLSDGVFDLSTTPKVIGQLQKMGLLEGFWERVVGTFGYQQKEPSIAGLLRHLFVTDFAHQAGDVKVDALAHFDLPASGRQNAAVCLTQWRDSSANVASYDAAAEAVSADLRIKDHLSALSLDSMAEVFTFWDCERTSATLLKERVLEQVLTIDAVSVTNFASQRRAGHWLQGPNREKPERKALADAYGAIVAAAELFALMQTHQSRLRFDAPEDLLQAYQAELYHFDQLYRWFHTKAKSAQKQGWDLLKSLAEKVEDVYGNGYLQPLGLEWSRHLDNGFLDEWQSNGMPAQQNFYAKTIRPHLRESERKRAYVIISDGLRFEAAQELVSGLKGKYRMDADLSCMLSVLPSYTALGMAGLLPHKRLSYSASGEVLADDKSTAGTEGRNKRLETVQGMACQAKYLSTLKREQARDYIADRRVVYIYHDLIDARGDTASTEGETFQAVEECIRELEELVQFCVNTLNASNVWVTADHGFIYQEGKLGVTDRSQLEQKPANAVKAKKRYVIGSDLGIDPGAHHGAIQAIDPEDGGMEFWVPRGANRFHFVGGAKYVHGGAMPQEVVVPLVKVTLLRGIKKVESKSRKVGAQVLGSSHIITAPKHRFEILQTEAVGERREPMILKAVILDGSTEVSSLERVALDSSSGNMDDRKREVILRLANIKFDKTKPYRLVLRDADTEAEVQSVPVVIDRSFTDDF